MLHSDNEESKVQVKKVLDSLSEEWYLRNEEVRSVMGPNYLVDEVALAVGTFGRLYSFLETAVQFDGYELFNVACDTVQTSPIPASYHIGYWFLRTPNAFRIEVMKLQGGYSPIHSGFEGIDLDMVQVHASFRCKDVSDYANAGVALRQAGYELAMRCDSGYGKFSYYIDQDKSPWYIKPRVNLRDAVPVGEQA